MFGGFSAWGWWVFRIWGEGFNASSPGLQIGIQAAGLPQFHGFFKCAGGSRKPTKSFEPETLNPKSFVP